MFIYTTPKCLEFQKAFRIRKHFNSISEMMTGTTATTLSSHEDEQTSSTTAFPDYEETTTQAFIDEVGNGKSTKASSEFQTTHSNNEFPSTMPMSEDVITTHEDGGEYESSTIGNGRGSGESTSEGDDEISSLPSEITQTQEYNNEATTDICKCILINII